MSEKVGTEIDIHENRFYRIFPDEKGFVNAQIIDAGNGNFRITIVKQIQGMETTVRRYIDQDDFQKIQNRIDQLPDFTKERKIEMYEGMDFIRAEKIINDIPLPIPLWVICSPNHIRNIVPATIVVTVVILKNASGFMTKSADDSKPTDKPYP